VTDDELASALRSVFVDEGYTDAQLADNLFSPENVRRRGAVLVTRDQASGALAGMVVLVPPGGAARQIAGDSEAELHLLAVLPPWRGRGVGRKLVTAAVEQARARGYSRVVLSTQETMTAAQSVYSRMGFARLPERDWDRGDRRFLVFGLDLGPMPVE